MKRVFVFLQIFLVSLLVHTGFAQDFPRALEFAVTTHDFGTVYEKDGKVKCIFKFENKSAGAVAITRVASSCGCTVPDYQKEPIAAGKSGEIEVTYDTVNRPGKFQKRVYVYTSDSTEKLVLTIKGEVL